MRGEPLRDSLACARALVDNLPDGDEVALVVFDAKVKEVVPVIRLDESSRRNVVEALDGVRAGWGTDLCGAVMHAALLGRGSLATRVIVLTDGHPYIGEVDPGAIVRHIREETKGACSVATIGVGSEIDHLLLRSMALAGRGRFTHVETGASVAAAVGSELAVIDGTTLVNVRAELVVSAAARHPTTFDCGPTSHDERRVSVELPPVVVGQPYDVVFELERTGSDHDELGLLTIRGTRAADGSLVQKEIPLRITRAAQSGPVHREVAMARCRARLVALMHEAGCDTESAPASLAAKLGRRLGALDAEAALAGLDADPSWQAAVRLVSDVIEDLLLSLDDALNRLRVASQGIAQGYDPAPGAAGMDLGAYRSASQHDGIHTILSGIRRR